MTELQKSLMLNVAVDALTKISQSGGPESEVAQNAILDMNAIQEATFPAIVAMGNRLDEEALEAERKGTPHAA